VTRVSVPLPRLPDFAVQNQQVKKKDMLPSFNFPPGKRVLITDDNKVNRKIIGRMLFLQCRVCRGCQWQGSCRYHPGEPNVTGDSNALIWVDIDGSSDASNGWLRGHGDLRGDGVGLPIVALTANAPAKSKSL
jgi:hypothetical protein